VGGVEGDEGSHAQALVPQYHSAGAASQRRSDVIRDC